MRTGEHGRRAQDDRAGMHQRGRQLAGVERALLAARQAIEGLGQRRPAPARNVL